MTEKQLRQRQGKSKAAQDTDVQKSEKDVKKNKL